MPLKLDINGTKSVELGKLASSPHGQTTHNGVFLSNQKSREEVIVQREDFIRVLEKASRPIASRRGKGKSKTSE